MKSKTKKDAIKYGEFKDSMGNIVRVIEAKKGKLPAVWIFSKPGSPRLNLEQAKNLRNALNGWINDTMRAEPGAISHAGVRPSEDTRL